MCFLCSLVLLRFFREEHVSGSCCSNENMESCGTNLNPTQTWSPPQLLCSQKQSCLSQSTDLSVKNIDASCWKPLKFEGICYAALVWQELTNTPFHFGVKPHRGSAWRGNYLLAKFGGIKKIRAGALSFSEKSTFGVVPCLVWHGSGEAALGK